MDIAPYIALGDRYLANQYYFVITPLHFVFLGAGLLVPAWFGAWYGGKTGLLWAVIVQLLALGGLDGYFLARLFHVIREDDSADAAFRLTINFSLIEVMIALMSATGAWFWIRMRGARRSMSGPDLR